MSVLIDYSSGAFAANQAQSVGTITAGTGTYNLAVASYDSVSFSVASQETTPNNIIFNDDGTSMYIMGSATDAIYQYTLSTAWDLSTASYASKSFSTSGETTPRDFTFNNDGTKIYYVGSGSDTVYQYSLSTAYDISTASTDNKSLSIASQAGTPTGVELKSDGTKLYISDGSTDAIYQYSLSTAFDVSTGSYDSVSFSFSSQGTNTQSIFFSPDGTSLFVCDTASSNDTVYKYSLSTAWDVSTLSYANESFSLAGQDDPFGVAFKSDGTKMYMVGVTNDTIYQYSTGTATSLDISSGTYFNYTPSANTTFTFSNAPASGTAAGFALAVTGRNGAAVYDIANASYDNVDFLTKASGNGPTGVFFKPDGTKFYISDRVSYVIRQYSLTTAWDITTATEGTTKSVSSQDTKAHEVFFKPDGTKMFVLGQNNNKVFEYDLSTAWDSSTASYNNVSFDITTQETLAHGLCFNPAGTKMFTCGNDGPAIYQYDLSTAWDASSASFTQSFSVTSQDTKPTGIFFTPDGTRMIISGNGGDNIYQYSLTSGFDISTASYDNVFISISGQMTGPQGLFFKSDGTKMYALGFNNRKLRQYTTGSTATATFSYPASVEWTSGTAPDGPAIGETDVLVFLTDDGGVSYQGFQAGDAMSVPPAKSSSPAFNEASELGTATQTITTFPQTNLSTTNSGLQDYTYATDFSTSSGDTGTIFELGGSTFGLNISLYNNLIEVQGSNTTNATGDFSSHIGETGTLYVSADYQNKIDVYWYSLNTMTLIVSTPTSGDYVGTDASGVAAVGGGYVYGTGRGNFSGTITEWRNWSNTYFDFSPFV